MVIQKIFFSYSRVDGAAFAQRLAADLKNKGYDVWIDQEDIRAGTEWDLAIEQALVNCDCMLFLETERSVASKNVLDEVYYALEQNKKVIPVIVVDSKTPFRLQRLQHIDCSKNYDTGLNHLLLELQGSATGEKVGVDNSNPNVTASPSFFTKHKRLAWMIATLVVMAVMILLILQYNRQSEAVQTNAIDQRGTTLNSDAVAGNWALVNAEPKARSHNGYLKIEAIDDKRVSIKAYAQFYYFPANDTSNIEIFNGFTGCTSCSLANDIKLAVEDIAIGSRTIIISKGADGTKAGDTTRNASSNKSITASASLHFIDVATADLKVQRREPTPLPGGVVLPPFFYTFRYKKVE